MKIEVIVPTLPESIVEATVAKVLRKQGEYVKKNDSIIDLETDKIMLSITAQKNGILDSVLISEGDMVKADQVVAVIDPKESSLKEGKDQEVDEKQRRYGPSVRKVIAEKEIDINSIQGSGKKGRVYKADLDTSQTINLEKNSVDVDKKHEQKCIQHNEEKTPEEENTKNDPVELVESFMEDCDTHEKIPLSQIRVGMVKDLLQAQNNSITLTVFDEINMSNVVDIRTLYKEKFLNTHNIRLGFTSFFIKAVAQAFRFFPAMNSSLTEDSIIHHKHSNIGITINTNLGTVTPVVRNVENKSIADIEKRVFAFSEKAKNGGLGIEDIQDSTFTIKNGSSLGSISSTSIINFPQNATLSIHKVADKPYVVQGKIRIRPIMCVSLSYNYCAIDSKYSADFLSKIKELLENPYLLLLDT